MVNQAIEDTLDDWEGDGGRIAAANASNDSPPHPWLPAGYQTQRCLGFRGRIHYYEFNRVYGPPDQADERGPISLLDEGMSYWEMTPGASRNDPADDRVSYEQARAQLGSSLTFAQFCSPRWMREKLPALLQPSPPSLVTGGLS